MDFSFQRSFYLVYFAALLGDWLQGPYVYKLYAYYGFKESQIAVLYVVSDWLISDLKASDWLI